MYNIRANIDGVENSSCEKISSEKQICSLCAEGAYWLKLDPNEVFCPKISLLHNGKCLAYRKIE